MNNNTDLSVFSFQNLPVRTVIINDEIWFVASDVCQILDIANVSQACEDLDDDERNTISIRDGIPGNPNRLCINEPGIYGLVLVSRKPEAKAFKRWLKHEVIPSIRKTGSYSTHQQYPSTGNEFIDTMISTMPAPASYAELQRVKRWVNATEALYYPDRTVKKFEKEEKQAQKLLSEVQLSEELLESAIIHKMIDLKEKGIEWATAAVMYAYLKKSTRQEIERRMKSLVELRKLEKEKTSRALRFKLTA